MAARREPRGRPRPGRSHPHAYRSTHPGPCRCGRTARVAFGPSATVPGPIGIRGKVTTPELWWQKRRPEIALDFEREVYGRVPKDVPKVTWTVAETVQTTVGGQRVVARQVIGHVDDSAHPAVAVDIKMAVVVPVRAEGPVPVLMMFGGGNMPGESRPRFPGAQEPAAPPSTDQLIAAGWGYVSLSTASIQADNGAGLASGVIGLTNKGQRRTPEQWGSLRAWAWGNTGLLDGELAWRQHDGGHEDRSNMSFCIAWANRLLHHTPLAPGERRARRRRPEGWPTGSRSDLSTSTPGSPIPAAPCSRG